MMNGTARLLAECVLLRYMVIWIGLLFPIFCSADDLEIIGDIPTKGMLEAIAVSPDTGIGFGFDRENVRVSAFDSGGIIHSAGIPLSDPPRNLAADPSIEYAYITTGSLIYKMNSSAEFIRKNLNISNPHGIVVNPASDTVVLAMENCLRIFSTDYLFYLKSIPLFFTPKHIALDSDANRAVVSTGNGIAVVDLNSGGILRTIELSGKVTGLAVDTQTNIAVALVESTEIILVQIDRGSFFKPDGVDSTDMEINGLDINQSTHVAVITGKNRILLLNLITNHLSEHRLDETFDLHSVSVDKKKNTAQICYTQTELNKSGILFVQLPNPLPEITGINPTQAVLGAPETLLRVEGSQFMPQSTVQFGQTYIPTYFEDNTILDAQIRSSLLLQAGTYPITVMNPSPGGGVSNPVLFSVIDPAPPNPVPVITGLSPASVEAGSPDFILTLIGIDFLPEAIARFNNQIVQSTFVSASRIDLFIPADAVQASGNYPVTLENPAPGGGLSNAVGFEVYPATPVNPLPDGSFGSQYEDLIPVNASIESYDPNRFSILTGKVRNKNQEALTGVSVFIKDHPEYGSAMTGHDGAFSIPVEGGGSIIGIYKKSGFITSHRQINTRWNDIAVVEDIILIPEDTLSTVLTFDGNPDTVLTHKSSTITDASGSRSLTMVFSGDNRAYAKTESGEEIELTTITTRATEFETPASMPAKLPPNSAFTYCSELSVDGAKNVRFDKPVAVYVRNFLGFHVGEIVPVGSYDRNRGMWVPSKNGRVVMLLDTNGDGIVDAFDSVGDGKSHGSATGLDDPVAYPPNTTWWRVEVDHFTPWDCNWPYGPPQDAVSPNPSGEPSFDTSKEKDDVDCTGSYVERRNRIFHEDIPIPGTNMKLHYASSRVSGFKHTVTIPASGETVPACLKHIIVQMIVAGKTYKTVLEPLPNQHVEFTWDGLDYLGRIARGSVTAIIKIGFVYLSVYYSARSDFEQSFAQAGEQVTGIRGREEIISWKEQAMVIEKGEANYFGKGWTLSSNHYLGVLNQYTLQKGDGSTLTKNGGIGIITTVAGNGQSGYSGDGGPAIEASFFYPLSLGMQKCTKNGNRKCTTHKLNIMVKSSEQGGINHENMGGSNGHICITATRVFVSGDCSQAGHSP